MSAFTQGHALIIGVGDYQDSKWSVPITAAEAQAVAEALMDPAVGGYPSNQVATLSGEHATCDFVVNQLEALAKRAQPTDTVLIFFSGHGAPGDDGQYYFATHETTFVSNSAIKAGSGLSQQQLLDLLRAIKVQKLLVIINACFSGNVTATLGSATILGAPPPATLSDSLLQSGAGRVVLTASRANQYSHFLKTQTYTFFGQALIEGLRGKAGKPGSGYVGLYELYEQIYTSVKAAAATLGQAQEPVLNIVEGVGPFPLARYPGATAASLGPEAIQQALPAGMAVRQTPAVVQVAGRDVVNIQSGGSVTIDQSRKLIDFGSGNKIENVTFGDVAEGDIIKTTIGSAPADRRRDLFEQLDKLQARVARLTGVPQGEREDAEDDLRRAREAGGRGETERMVSKLESARVRLVAMGKIIPAAGSVAAKIEALLVEARRL